MVITKCDMADPEWVEMVKEDVRTHVEGTFLEGKPVFTVSAYTGQGIPELRQALKELVQKAAEKNMRTPFRLPIDRVFSVDGFGTVVTGTLIEGSVSNGDMAEILPGRGPGPGAEPAGPRQGCGDRLCRAAGGHQPGRREEGRPGPGGRHRPARLRPHLPDAGRAAAKSEELPADHPLRLPGPPLPRLRRAACARWCLLDRDALQPGESCYAQLRLTEEIAAKRGDRFVIRFYSPLETIGGGVVLDDLPRRHKRGDQAVLEALAIRESGSGDDQLVQLVAEHGHSLPTLEKLAAPQNLDREELGRSLEELTSAGKVLQPLPGRYLAASVFDAIWDSCRGLLEQYHRQNPLHAGMKVAELRQKLLKNTDQAVADAILAALAREGKIKAVADRYALADFAVHLTKRQNAIREKLLQTYRKAGLEVPGLDEVIASFPPAEQGDCRQVVESLVSGGGLVMLTPQLCLHSQVYAQVCDKTRDFMAEHQELTLAEFRDLLGTSRKYALAVLEYYDKNKILKKDGDVRRLGTGF